MASRDLLGRALADLSLLDGARDGEHSALSYSSRPSPDFIYALGLVVLARYEECQAKRPGRPPHPFERNLILHAAYVAELGRSRSKTDARDAARRRLGSSVTITQVEKASTAAEAELARRFGSVNTPKAAVLIARAQEHLERIERRMKADGQAFAHVRVSDRHVRAVGA